VNKDLLAKYQERLRKSAPALCNALGGQVLYLAHELKPFGELPPSVLVITDASVPRDDKEALAQAKVVAKAQRDPDLASLLLYRAGTTEADAVLEHVGEIGTWTVLQDRLPEEAPGPLPADKPRRPGRPKGSRDTKPRCARKKTVAQSPAPPTGPPPPPAAPTDE
jgi:hypothetical protein